jgi:hypothetical protein
MPGSMTTCEDLEALCQRFPRALLEDKQFLKGRGDVTKDQVVKNGSGCLPGKWARKPNVFLSGPEWDCE